jgi:hypothetical protein
MRTTERNAASTGPPGWGYLNDFARATIGGRYADDPRIEAIEVMNEPHEDVLVPFIDHMATLIKSLSKRPVAHEPAYNHKSTVAAGLADIWSEHIYGGNPATTSADMYATATQEKAAVRKTHIFCASCSVKRSFNQDMLGTNIGKALTTRCVFSQAVAANKTMLITEYAKRPAQPYCAALRGALAAGVGSYAWELMLGIDQFGPLEGAGTLSIGPPYKGGPVYQGGCDVLL